MRMTSANQLKAQVKNLGGNTVSGRKNSSGCL
jgi:hypothetical protein